MCALNCEFSNGKGQYAHIPWQVAVVDVASVDEANIQSVSAHWNYSLTTKQCKKAILKAKKSLPAAIDNTRMRAWLDKQATTYAFDKAQDNMSGILSADEISKALISIGVDKSMLLLTWGTTSADACAFAKI
jgi:hypothetical protein